MAATVAEISESGFGGMTLEAVAARAGVHRTTIYRRWPTKTALVRAAVAHEGTLQLFERAPDTGDLRRDLLELVRVIRAQPHESKRRATMLAVLSESSQTELSAFVPAIRRKLFAPLPRILERAVERGELPPETDAELVWRPLFAALNNEILFGEPRSERFFASLIDVLVAGVLATVTTAAAGSAAPRSPGRRSR